MYKRELNLINKYIEQLRLDLKGYKILTEAGTGHFILTPLIPILGGAQHVYALAKDNRYGKAKEVKEKLLFLTKKIGVESKLTVYENTIPDVVLSDVDIVTNSGNLRPLDEHFIKKLNKDCVIPLMYEAWEKRDSDIDFSKCHKKGIKIAGTWEDHPKVNVFQSFGSLSVKLALEAGFEIHNNNILIWSDDNFGDVSKKAFLALGASNVLKTTDMKILKSNLNDLDFIYFCRYEEQRAILSNSKNGILDYDEIINNKPSLGIIHMYGELDYPDFQDLNIYPKKNGNKKIMSETLAYIGASPLLSLLAGGFKVGELLKKGIFDDSLIQVIKEKI